MVRRYDRQAEHRFAELCAEHGAVSNKSIEDENGWDYIVEFRESHIDGLPADLVPAQKSALVQIKSTITQKAKCELKLSNALRFAKAPMPCFIVLMAYRQNSKKARIYAVHFWKDLIGRTLQRAREADRDGRSDLHRLKLILNFGTEDEIGDGVVSWLERQIDNFSPDYASAKRTIVQGIGYESGGKIVRVTFDPIDSIDELVDHQLGLGGRISPSHVELVDRRFGIDTSTPIFSGKPDHFRMVANPRGQGASIRLRNIDGEELGLTGDLITPGIPNLPEEHLKCRIRTWMLDIIWPVSGAPSSKLGFDFRTKRPLRQFSQLAQFISWSEKGAIDYQVWCDDNRLFGGKLNVNLPAEKELMKVVGQAASVLDRVAGTVAPSNLAVSLVDIHAASKELDPFIEVLTGPKIDIGLNAEADTPIDNMLAYEFAEVGDWTFMAVIERPVIDDCIEGRKRHLTFGQARWLEHYAKPGASADNVSLLYEDYQRHLSNRGRGTLACKERLCMWSSNHEFSSRPFLMA